MVKDWILIGLSVWLYKAPVSAVNIGGYLVAFAAVLWYNYAKIQVRRCQQHTPLPMPGLSLQKSYLNITTSDLLLLTYKLTTMLHACGPLETFCARLGGDGSFLRQRGGDQLMLSSCAGRDV